MTKKRVIQRKARIRTHLKRVASRPRLTVFRSNKYIWAQIIDDAKGSVLVAFSDKNIESKLTKKEKAEKVGEQLAKAAMKKKITRVYFDRGSMKYHGRIQALAEAARKEGLEF